MQFQICWTIPFWKTEQVRITDVGISSLIKVLPILQDPAYAHLYIQFSIEFNLHA